MRVCNGTSSIQEKAARPAICDNKKLDPGGIMPSEITHTDKDKRLRHHLYTKSGKVELTENKLGESSENSHALNINGFSCY